MSSDAQPIDPARFALALESLPLDALHSKAAELRNSISHLKSSNEQMLPFAEEGDDICREAMFENLGVIGRMNERISLLRAEVEKRGMRWSEGEVEDKEARDGELVNGDSGVNGMETVVRQPSGRLTDEELRRQMEAQMGDEEEGLGMIDKEIEVSPLQTENQVVYLVAGCKLLELLHGIGERTLEHDEPNPDTGEHPGARINHKNKIRLPDTWTKI